MDKEQLLSTVTEFSRNKTITARELLSAYEKGKWGEGKASVLSKILYTIGASILLVGIIALIGQYWNDLSSLAHIVISLGSSIASYFIALLILQSGKSDSLVQTAFGVSAILLPIGLAITFIEFEYDNIIVIPTIALAVAGLSLALFRNFVFTIATIVFGTWELYQVIEKLTTTLDYSLRSDIFIYTTMVLGLLYILLGYIIINLKKTWGESFSSLLYFAGASTFLGAALSLGGVWDILFSGFVTSMIILSLYLKSRALLVAGTLFIVIYLIKLTSEYFADSIGWPVALVVIGLFTIAVGFMAVNLHKRFISKTSS